MFGSAKALKAELALHTSVRERQLAVLKRASQSFAQVTGGRSTSRTSR